MPEHGGEIATLRIEQAGNQRLVRIDGRTVAVMSLTAREAAVFDLVTTAGMAALSGRRDA